MSDFQAFEIKNGYINSITHDRCKYLPKRYLTNFKAIWDIILIHNSEKKLIIDAGMWNNKEICFRLCQLCYQTPLDYNSNMLWRGMRCLYSIKKHSINEHSFIFMYKLTTKTKASLKCKLTQILQKMVILLQLYPQVP